MQLNEETHEIVREIKDFVDSKLCSECRPRMREEHPNMLECAFIEFGDEHLCPKLERWFKEAVRKDIDALHSAYGDGNPVAIDHCLWHLVALLKTAERWQVDLRMEKSKE